MQEAKKQAKRATEQKRKTRKGLIGEENGNKVDAVGKKSGINTEEIKK